MAKPVLITRFDGGMTNDPQDMRENVARVTKHLDNYTLPHSITPYPDNDFDATTDPNSAANFSAWKIKQFLYAPVGTTNSFFGLGVQSTTVPAIYTKAAIGDAWALANTTGDYASLTALGAGMTQQFIYYQSYLYGIDGGGWWKYGDITGTPSWTRQVYTTTYLNLCQPIVHSKNDVMYAAGGQGTAVSNRIIMNVDGTWSTPIVLGLYTKIPSICEYGNYLAIAANNPIGTSTVLLWDQDATNTEFSEKIDWGSGQIKWIRQIGGMLIGCSILQPSGLDVAPTVSFKYYNGSSVTEFAQFTCTSATVYGNTQLYNNIVYFGAEIVIDGETLSGIWKVVKHNDGRMSVSFDRLPKLDTAPDAGTLYGFLRTGDYFHIGMQTSATHIVTKTLSTYTTTAKWITPKYNGGNISQTKKLTSVTVLTEPMNSSGSVVLKYKVDSETSYTTIFTNTNTTAGAFVVDKEYTIISVGTTDFTSIGASENTAGIVFTATGVGSGTGTAKRVDNLIRKTAINIESSGANLPLFKQIQFSAEPSNAVVTGIKFTYDEINDDLI